MPCISRREPEEPEDATKGRDVFNEKPPADELLAVSDIGKALTTSLPENVVSSLNFCVDCEIHYFE
jgi:peptidylprolyl isomerase domain and WD repeat-containing protein 1